MNWEPSIRRWEQLPGKVFVFSSGDAITVRLPQFRGKPAGAFSHDTELSLVETKVFDAVEKIHQTLYCLSLENWGNRPDLKLPWQSGNPSVTK